MYKEERVIIKKKVRLKVKIDRTNFKRQEKKLKNRHKELIEFEKVIRHIRNCKTFQELCEHEFSKLYKLELLKEDLTGYYSFNLCKNSGKIRLIFSINEELNIIRLVFISTNNYEDFKKYIKK